jgi:MFS family permease
MYTGAFIGALVGFAISGLISDWSAKMLTKWNRGVYEPEFRMVLVVPQLILGGAGLYGFGITASDPYRYSWIWPDFFFGCTVAGMVCGAVGSALYVVDAHRESSRLPSTSITVIIRVFVAVVLMWYHRRHVDRSLHLPPCVQELVLIRPDIQGL